MYGTDYEYARTRIESTILCLKSGEPVYIHEVNAEDGQCRVSKLSDANDNTKKVELDDINFKPPRLGYVNTRGHATYLSRIPMRRDWKQGLRRENMSSTAVHIRDVRYSDIANCLLNKYPKLNKAYEALLKTPALKSIAFHRNWAINNTLSISYKGKVVGMFNSQTTEITLNSGFSHLTECLQESL